MKEWGPQATGERLVELLSGATDLILIAPFIKAGALQRVLESLNDRADVVVYTRWRPQEIAQGVSDLEVFDLVRGFSGQVFLHPLLHAKAYISGERALVGSSNTTLSGLGWAAVPSLESLHEVRRTDVMLEKLLAVLNRASCKATRAIQENVAAQAALLDVIPVDFEPLRQDEDSISAFWVPRFNVPESVWAAYRGQRPEAIQKLVLRDLRALGVPAGVRDEASFRAIVGGALSQGFTGRLIQECANLNAVDAADRFRLLLSESGVDMPPGALGERYQAFVRWVSFFIPRKTLRASGYTIS